jgi:uncharacterized RDD family membrane protein YckC
VGFDPSQLKAPFLLRCGALLIDYILLIIVPVATLLIGRSFGFDGSKLLNSPIANSGWLITFLIFVTNLLILPVVNGQSLGKMLTNIKITAADGARPSIFSMALRHLVGYPLTLLTGGLGFAISAFTPGGRALHDYVAGTFVVYGHKAISEKRYVKKTDKAAG